MYLIAVCIYRNLIDIVIEQLPYSGYCTVLHRLS